MDRAAGATATLRELAGTGLRFLTALRRPEFQAYAPKLPSEGFDTVHHDDPKEMVAAAARQAIQAGLTREADDLFVWDLGVVTRTAPERDAPVHQATSQGKPRAALELAIQATAAVENGQVRSYNIIAQQRGISRTLITKYRRLLRLVPTLKTALLEGQPAGLSLDQWFRIARLPESEQEAAVRAIATPPTSQTPTTDGAHDDQAPLRVRCVAYFNPEILVQKRTNARLQLEEVRGAVKQLNEKLAKRSQPLAQIRARIDRLLQRHHLLDVFSFRIETTEAAGTKRQLVYLDFDDHEWRRRRQFDGFSVLVAHPDLDLPAAEICRLYRSRARIEQDFRTIKSFIQLNPVRHRIEHKVRAHVSICMLALLLEL
jgi:hypothetical protein